jgi:hypothetical protein
MGDIRNLTMLATQSKLLFTTFTYAKERRPGWHHNTLALAIIMTVIITTIIVSTEQFFCKANSRSAGREFLPFMKSEVSLLR